MAKYGFYTDNRAYAFRKSLDTLKIMYCCESTVDKDDDPVMMFYCKEGLFGREEFCEIYHKAKSEKEEKGRKV